jgi:thermostable 8-oxoguanine DNA glycosylase
MEFRIPESNRVDDFRIDRVRPTKNRTYMELALCTLFANTGFWVYWGTLRED